MSQHKVIASTAVVGATAASLPVTGSPAVTTALIGAGMVLIGLLAIRSSRLERADENPEG